MPINFNEKNFLNREFILDLFNPNMHVWNKVWEIYETIKGTTCSIHVRRGDYVNNPGYAKIPASYYEKAMSKIKVDKYLVFSDEIEYCKTIFRGEKFIFVKDLDHVELFLMTLCDHNIIANSTFSWWGAYLNQNPAKIVIAPDLWVGDNRCTTDDIVPKEWIKL